MHTKQFFPKFNQAVLFQRKRSAAAVAAAANVLATEDEDQVYSYPASSSHYSAAALSRGAQPDPSSSTATGSLLILVCLASAFMLLAVLGTTFYYYNSKKRSGSLLRTNHKVLLLKKDLIPLEKSFLINSYNTTAQTNNGAPVVPGAQGAGKTKAVRSPSSGQVNPFQKKTPSPTGAKESLGNSPHQEESCKGTSAISEINNNDHSQTPLLQNVGKRNSKNQILNSIENIHEATLVKDPLRDSGISSSTKKDSIDGGAVPNLGKLHFKLKYSYEKRALSLEIIRCAELPGPKEGSNGTMDPYVKMQLLPEKQHKAKTRVLRKTQNPIYNEEFTFYGITSNLLESLVVHFVVLNFDRFSRDEILGEVVCKLNQFEFDSLEKQITLVRDIAPRGNKIQELGEVLVSLCYQPIANRLTVVILKARNLPKMDLTGLCDPYVKIYVFHNGQRIFKKRTHVKKRTLSPVFNESFVFDIPPEEGLDNIQMQFLVYDHDRVTRNELIGKIDISCKTGNPATEKHWNEVIKSPRRQIAEWHKLKEC